MSASGCGLVAGPRRAIGAGGRPVPAARQPRRQYRLQRRALYEWPDVQAIVGTPPFLGGLKIRSELGPEYLQQLQVRYPGVNGRADFCAYWFRRAHDHLREGGRAGLVATNTVREGNTREPDPTLALASRLSHHAERTLDCAERQLHLPEGCV